MTPRHHTQPRAKRLSLTAAVSLAILQIGSAWAQTASPTPTPSSQDGLKLDEVIVTGTAVGGSKMKQSVSISTLDSDQILKTAPTNAAEILRAIPGVRSESSGGEGNANLTVRGLPISAGGARYVQFQKDGLPILLFGDIAFATPDMFLRTDYSLDRLEVVRGGSASTLATNAPGGIVNFITKTGETKGGSVGISKGVGFDQTRYDFEYGSPLTSQTRFYLAGFYRNGDGARPAGVPAEDGGQLSGNITHEIDNGFLRVGFSRLNDKSPMNMPVPVKITNGNISEYPTINPRTASFYSPYWVMDKTIDKNNNPVFSNVNDGLRVKSDSFNFEGEFKLANGWTLAEKFRTSANSGRFISIFPSDDPVAGNYVYATGPNKGKAYTGLAFNPVVFNTSLDDLGSTVNDLKISKSFEMADKSKIVATAGLFTQRQNVGLTWNFNQYLMEANGSSPALLQTANSTPGLVNQGTDQWGGCCTRNIAAQYKTTSPYAAFTYEKDALNVDGSIRMDNQTASGTFNQGAAQIFNQANTQVIKYKVNHTSYSFGANYRIDPNTAVFARYSDGVAFNADRIMFNNYQLNGSTPIPINEVKQLEAGVKWRQGPLSTFATFFSANTKESNYDATTQKVTANSYGAKGIELEAAYRSGGFRLAAGATFTKAEITDSLNKADIGTVPNRQANWVYQVSPSYSFGNAVVGASVIGNTDSRDANPIAGTRTTLPGFFVVNLFGSYEIAKNLTVNASVNNLLNVIGYTESNDGRMAARSINGRTVKAGLKYDF
jgi:outer membrane receptor protein involved in Fe transport